MSDNKKYYYLKLKENYFDQDHIKVIEAMDNGYIYSLILMKLYLKAIKGNGCLLVTEGIPYDPTDTSMLARVINHDPDHVNKALSLAKSFKLIDVIDQSEIWFSDMQTFIGQSSTEGDRKRKYRAIIAEKQLKLPKNKGGQMSDKRPPELEIDIELEKEKEKEKNKHPKSAKADTNLKSLVGKAIKTTNLTNDYWYPLEYFFTNLKITNYQQANILAKSIQDLMLKNPGDRWKPFTPLHALAYIEERLTKGGGYGSDHWNYTGWQERVLQFTAHNFNNAGSIFYAIYTTKCVSGASRELVGHNTGPSADDYLTWANECVKKTIKSRLAA